jgi:hypothetical protein
MSPPSEAATPERAVPPDASAEGADIAKSVEAPRGERASDSPREAPAPGEDRSERREEAPAADIPRDAPPPGEERPERRTP